MVVPSSPHNNDLWCTKLGGMPFIARQARLAAKANVSQVWILSPKSLDAVSACVPDHRYAPNLKTLIWDSETESLGDVISTLPEVDQYIVFAADCVYQPQIFSNLAKFQHPDHQRGEIISTGNQNQPIWISDADSLALAIEAISNPTGKPADNYIAPAYEYPVFKITSHDDMNKLEEHLWGQCRKDIDGLVSTWFNRHISLAISRSLINSSITPNQVTIFAVLLGIVASLIASGGGYLEVLIGAFLLQASSIIDGVDGEIARMRVQGSVLGEWLDTIGDDLVNISFVLAIGYGSYVSGNVPIWSYMAVFCAFLMLSISAIYYVWLSRAGRGDILSTDWFHTTSKQVDNQQQNTTSFSALKSAIIAWATRLFRRDLLIAIIFLTALAGVVHYSLLIFIPASLATLAAQLVKMLGGKNEPH